MSEMEENCNLDDPRPQMNISLPWPVYNSHFKVNKILKDNDYDLHKTFEVSCNHCVTRKTLTADSRSMSNLRKHLKVSRYNYYTRYQKISFFNICLMLNKIIKTYFYEDVFIENNVIL